MAKKTPVKKVKKPKAKVRDGARIETTDEYKAKWTQSRFARKTLKRITKFNGEVSYDDAVNEMLDKLKVK